MRLSQQSDVATALLDKLLENQHKPNWYGSFIEGLKDNGEMDTVAAAENTEVITL